MEEEANIMLGKTGPMGHFYPHELLLMEVLRLCQGEDGVGPLASGIAASHRPCFSRNAIYISMHLKQLRDFTCV
jgi:hypothetical protein